MTQTSYPFDGVSTIDQRHFYQNVAHSQATGARFTASAEL